MEGSLTQSYFWVISKTLTRFDQQNQKIKKARQLHTLLLNI